MKLYIKKLIIVMYCLFDCEYCYLKKINKPILTEFSLILIDKNYKLECVLYNRLNYNLFKYKVEDYIQEYTYCKYMYKNTFRNSKKYRDGISFTQAKKNIYNVIKKYNIVDIYMKGVSKFDLLFFENINDLNFIDLIDYGVLKYDDYSDDEKIKILNKYKDDLLIRFNIILDLSNLNDHISLNEILVFSNYFILQIKTVDYY